MLCMFEECEIGDNSCSTDITALHVLCHGAQLVNVRIVMMMVRHVAKRARTLKRKPLGLGITSFQNDFLHHGVFQKGLHFFIIEKKIALIGTVVPIHNGVFECSESDSAGGLSHTASVLNWA